MDERGVRSLACPRVLEGVVMKTHTYFTESPAVLVWTGTAKPGPPSVSGADTAVLAGVWPARRNHCENGKWGLEGTLGGGPAPAGGGTLLGSSFPE